MWCVWYLNIYDVSVYAGPGESGTKQFSSNLWSYASAVSPIPDAASGLIGAIVVVDPRFITTLSQQTTASPCDVDQEVFLLLAKMEEEKSW